METETLKNQLQELIELVNSLSSKNSVTLNQQDIQKRNMSISGGEGRLYIQPNKNGYDISLSGKVIQEEMYHFMVHLCGAECTGHKQKNEGIGKFDQPFWRVDDFDLVRKAAYHYAGVNSKNESSINYPEEVKDSDFYIEGATKTVSINVYERNVEAREKCLAHYGYKCIVCDFDFESVYGVLGKEYIHVHHIIPLSEIKKEYTINPIQDLVPVCPNCHSMIHRVTPALKIEQLKEII